MKKAKVLVPVLSMLCFSAVACVTGTVAWFTSASTAVVQTNSFAIKPLEGSVQVVATAGVGTAVTYEESTSIYTISADKFTPAGSATEESNALTHGSFDCAAMQCWTKKYEDIVSISDKSKLTKTDEAEFRADGKVGLYHVMTWDLQFIYDYGTNGSAPDINLYFDTEESSATVTGALESLDTARGFRMGFMNQDTVSTEGAVTDWTVWSPFQNKTLDQNADKPASCYVQSSTVFPAYNPAETGNLIYGTMLSGSAKDPITKASGSKAGTARKDYLGTFTPTALPSDATKYKGTINLKIAIWYEGLDDNITEASIKEKAVACGLHFYLRDAETVSA